MPTAATALDRRTSYYGAHLSDNIVESPEGFLYCKNAVIGRTGFQTYRVSELADPDGLLATKYKPHEGLPIWRDPREVFSDETIASFEGKPFTLTHPDELLNPDNTHHHSMGHVQNVRPGTDALESGDMPLLADIVVTGREAIRAIKSGAREISCGYTYSLAREGHRYEQREIIGNHVALVHKGRAGDEARINDAAPPEPVVVAVAKERPVRIPSLKNLLSSGLQVFAKDAATTPEDVAAVLENQELAVVMGAVKPPARVVAADSIVDDKDKTNVLEIVGGKEITHDGLKMVLIGKTKDGTPVFKGMAVDSAAALEAETDARKKVHGRIDQILDAAEKNRGTGTDAELEKLTKDLNQLLALDEKEEKAEGKDAHPEGCRCDDCKGKSKDSEKEDLIEKDGEEEEETKDSALILAPNERPTSALDADTFRTIVADVSLVQLRLLKPFIARSGNKPLIRAYDTMVKAHSAVMKDSKVGKASYAQFLRAAATPNETARDSQATNGDAGWKPRETDKEKTAKEHDGIYAKVMTDRTASVKPN